MDKQLVQKILEEVKRLGKVLRDVKTVQVEQKNGIQDLVTQMDKQTEADLRTFLQRQMPDCTFVGEEGNQLLSDSMWIIDPIDGTTNFINAHEQYAISLAYYKNKKAVLGIVYDVQADTMYWAVKGQGAYINDHKVHENLPKRELSQCVFEASLNTLLVYPKLIDLFKQTRGHRSMGCCSLSVIRVALGKTDFYLTEQAKTWDYAAANIFLEECQGISWFQRDFFSCTANVCVFVQRPDILDIIQNCL